MKNTPILVVEDEPFIAIDLAFAITDAGGRVVGPAATVRGALDLLASTRVTAAILDVNLVDGDCSAIVEALAMRNIPMVLQSGMGLPEAMVAKFPGLVAHNKPCPAAALVAKLESLMEAAPGYGA